MLSIVIPAYNCRKTLPRTLDSLVTQTKKIFNVVIVNDCGEALADIVDRYRERGLFINYIVNEENLGAGLTRQVGFDAIKDMSDYVMFLDADDMLMPQAVEILYSEAKKTNANFLSSQIKRQKKAESGTIIPAENLTWLHGKIYNTKFLSDFNIRFSNKLRYNEDVLFNNLVYYYSKNSKLNYKIEEPTYLWSDNEESLTRENDGKTYLQKGTKDYFLALSTFYKFLIDKNDTDYLLTVAPKYIAHMYETYIKQRFLVKTNYKDMPEIVHDLLAAAPTLEIIKRKSFKKDLAMYLSSVEIQDNKIFVYPMNFTEFILESKAKEFYNEVIGEEK